MEVNQNQPAGYPAVNQVSPPGKEMKMKQNINGLAIAAVLLLAVAAAFVQSEKWLKHRAVQECKELSVHRERPNEWITVEWPIEEEYQKCIKAKGY